MSTDFDFIYYLDYLAKAFVGPDGGNATPIVLVLDDQYQCGVKFLLSNLGNYTEIQKQVRSIKASVGQIKAPPTSGNFSLKFTNGAHIGTTADIDFSALAADFSTACAGALDNTHAQLTMQNVALRAPCCWTFNLSGVGLTEPILIERVDNTLQPSSFVRVRPYMDDGRWTYEVRLLQSALAFTSGFDRVLPTAPSILTINNGSPRLPGSSANTNEVQSARIPLDFQGTYHFRFDYRTSKILGKDADEAAIEDALNGMYADGLKRFSVTNPVAGEAYVEFIGPLAESDQPELVIVVDSFPPGVIRFALDCDKEEFAAALRTVDEITDVPFEIELQVVNDNQDPSDGTIPSRKITFQTTCTIRADSIYDELDARQSIDWQQPAVAKSYAVVSPDQIIVGQQNFEVAFGDGLTSSFRFTHNLHTSAGFVTVRRRDSDGGGALGLATEYAIDFKPDWIDIELIDIPELDGLVLTFLAAGPRSVFLAHHHEISDINGLQTFIDSTTSTIGTILDRLPFTNPTISTPADQQIDLTIPDKFFAFPGKYAAPPKDTTTPTPLRTGYLLPALHKATVTDHDFTTDIPELEDAKGHVYRHTGAATVILPGGGTHKAPEVAQDALVGCDGRVWYLVRQQTGKNSFYAIDMEREFFLLPINSAMLRPGQFLEAHYKMLMQMVATSVVCQYVYSIDFGSPRAEADPSPTGFNIKDILWNDTPALQQPIVLSPLSVEAKFGFNVQRAQDDTIQANTFNYGSVVTAGDGKPASANFVGRVRFIEFDVVDNVDDPRGSVFTALTAGTITIR